MIQASVIEMNIDEDTKKIGLKKIDKCKFQVNLCKFFDKRFASIRVSKLRLIVLSISFL